MGLKLPYVLPFLAIKYTVKSQKYAKTQILYHLIPNTLQYPRGLKMNSNFLCSCFQDINGVPKIKCMDNESRHSWVPYSVNNGQEFIFFLPVLRYS